MNKLLSRKFLMALAAFLASIGTSIGAMAASNDVVAGIGIVCAMLSAAIYAATEAYVDAASVASNITSTTTSVSATTTSKETVEKLIPSTSTQE
jgi:uncharacterized membrane protein